MPTKNKNGQIVFKDFPEFTPNLSPREMFKLGSFGGTYWRPIYSSITNKTYKNQHKKFPYSWWSGIPEDNLTLPWNSYDKNINKYKVKVGTTLELWEDKGWITKYHPYGWVQWYCDFYQGNRSDDDERQVKRWLAICGDGGRFKKRLVNMIKNKKARYDDVSVSPKIRQTLQHWGCKILAHDIL